MISLSFILFSYWMSFWIAAYPDGALRVLEDGKDRSLKLPLEPWFMEKMTALLPKVGIERSLRLLGGGVNRKHTQTRVLARTHKHAYKHIYLCWFTTFALYRSSWSCLGSISLALWIGFANLFRDGNRVGSIHFYGQFVSIDYWENIKKAYLAYIHHVVPKT
jgi:hypothetical protein